MAANYAEIGRVGKLEADFQQVSIVQIFWNVNNIVIKHQSKNIFFDRNSKTNHFFIEV